NLRVLVARIVDLLKSARSPSLQDIAYTLQLGREEMNVRLVACADSKQSLINKLDLWLGSSTSSSGANHEPCVYGDTAELNQHTKKLLAGNTGEALSRQLALSREYKELALLWVQGCAVDWSLLHNKKSFTDEKNCSGCPKIVVLPTYHFLKPDHVG